MNCQMQKIPLFLRLVVLSPLLAAGIQAAHAQAGVGVVSDPFPVGTIGNNKGAEEAVQCPAGTVLRGVRHIDKSMLTFSGSTRGMTVRLDLYCARISTDGITVSVTAVNPNGTPDVNGVAYPDPGTVQNAYCGVNQVANTFGGWDRVTQDPLPWASAVNFSCRALQLNASDWITLNYAIGSTGVAGVRESNAVHTQRGPWCDSSDGETVVSGYHRQAGGEGYDGINVYCGKVRQARHSAAMSFTDFAWSQSLAPDGWLVNLTLGGTSLSSGRSAHAGLAANNTNDFQSAMESYVMPNSGYGATIGQHPAGIAANTYVTSGTCATGITLGDKVDNSCTLTVTGLPDIAVSMTTPAPAYTQYGQLQNVVLTATNIGPGATDGNDGFTVVATLPSGWTAGTLPANCTANVSNTVVTCALNPTPLAGATAPGGAGGSVSFTIPVTVNSPTTSGTYTANLALGRTVPDGDADNTNDDFNTANDTASGPLVFQLRTALHLQKALPQGRSAAADQFTLTIAGAGGPVSATTTGSGSTATEAATLSTATADTAYTLSETGASGANLAAYATSYACTNARAGGQTPSGSGTSFSVTPVAGDDLACTFTNVPLPPDVQVVKAVSPTTTVRPGQVLTYTITASNNGPSTATDAVLSDTPGAGLDCNTPSSTATCSASGGASCPSATVPVSSLTGAGITLPSLPMGGQVVVTLQCTVTATGLP